MGGAGSTETGLVARGATPEDYGAFVRLFPELAVPEQPPSAERFAEAIAPDAIVLTLGDAVVGYAWARPRGERLHVVHVIADLAHRHRGVGRALMNAAAARGRAAGLRRWMLTVKPENLAARSLYERCGMRVAFASALMRVAWRDVARIAADESVTARVLSPADDASFEEALGLPRGEVGAFRTLAGRVLVGAARAGAPAGFAAFDPAFPGASAFRAKGPGVARALFEVLRPMALVEHDHLLVFVEDDANLEAALAAAGAEVVMRALRMEGDIPAG